MGSDSSPLAPSTLSIQPATVLIVDDRPADLLAIESILDGMGLNLVKALSGEEALQRLAEGDVAVILLDVQMRGLDGFAVARRVRKDPARAQTPIIFLSAFDSSEFPLIQAYKLGAVDYLVKPLVPEILRAKVTMFVELHQKTERLRILQREEFERRLAAVRLHWERTAQAVTRAFAESTSTAEAIERVLQAICEALHWDAGALWTIDKNAGAMRCLRSWVHAPLRSPAFVQALSGLVFRRGIGLPGRVWAEAQACWVEQLIRDDNFPRLGAAIDSGLTSALAFPVSAGDHVIGVMELFSQTLRPREEDVLRALVGIGGQVGQFLERMRAEEALRESEERYRDLFQNAHDAIYTLDLQGRITSLNRRAKATLGLTPEEAVGRHASEFVFPEWVPVMDEALRRKLAGEASPTVYEVEVRGRAGQRIPLEVSTRLIYQNGKPIGVQGIARDITERKRAEETLREAGRRKDEFLATLAHELRNPLAPISNAVEILELSGDGPTGERAREILKRQVHQLTRLVDDLLDVSRITRGKINLRIERANLAGILQHAVEASRPLIEGGGQQLSITLPSVPVWLDADPARMSQVFANLLNNAAKYTEKGGRIELRAEQRREQGSDMAIVRIIDNGIGIAPEHLLHVFEMFSQVTPALERSQGGLGIGLALVRGIVELHGGRIEGHSQGLGMGSEFTVYLPVSRMAEKPSAHELDSDAVRSPSRLRLLVVDDSRDCALTLAMVLGHLGHEVQVVHTGREALQAAASAPDVVLLDIGMPDLNGYEVARQLRRHYPPTSMRLIALTGWGQPEDRQRALEAGFDEHLTKPVDVPQLLQAFASVLKAKSARNTATPRPS